MDIDHLDHLVLTVSNVEKTLAFYREILGMEVITFQETRKALQFGNQKINIHEEGEEWEPKAHVPTPGSADLCFITKTPLHEFMEHCRTKGIEIIEGPLQRTGAAGRIDSVYLRDPDQNLIEVSNYEGQNR